MTEQAVRMEKAGYITSAKAAGLLGNTVYTIYRHLKAGKFKGTQMAGHWYIERKSLLDWMMSKVKDGEERKRLRDRFERDAERAAS